MVTHTHTHIGSVLQIFCNECIKTDTTTQTHTGDSVHCCLSCRKKCINLNVCVCVCVYTSVFVWVFVCCCLTTFLLLLWHLCINERIRKFIFYNLFVRFALWAWYVKMYVGLCTHVCMRVFVYTLVSVHKNILISSFFFI